MMIKVRASKAQIYSVMRFVWYWILCVVIGSCLWFNHYFGSLEFEQIFYHLQFGYHGQLDVDPTLTQSYIFWCLVMTFFATIVIVYAISRLSEHKNFRRIPVTLLATILTLSYFLQAIHITDYVRFSSKPDYIAANYIAPTQISLNQKPLNLILLYVESLENTYTDEDLFGEDLLAKLNSLPGDRFTEYKQLRGCGWTMAGIVSSMCGIPLKPNIIGDNHNHIGRVVKKFLPGAICLGDILAQHGYTNVYMGGAELRFAGKGKFLQAHGYQETIGLSEFKDKGLNNFHNWGLYDDVLLKQAKIKLKELRAANKPYNLTLLTLDMHQPGGYISKYCAARGTKDYLGIVKCTSGLVYDFAEYLKKNGYLEDTVLVIVGDHVLMSPDEIDRRLQKSSKRGVYNQFVTPTSLPMNRDEIVHFDIFPTVLYALGFRFPDNRLGLGVSGYGEINESIGADRVTDLQKNILRFSDKYASFWLSTAEAN